MGAQVFLQLRLALAFPFPLHKCQAGKGAAAPSVAAWRPLVADHWFPACHLLSLSLSLSLTLFAASWRRAQAHFEVYEAAAAAAMAAAARGI